MAIAISKDTLKNLKKKNIYQWGIDGDKGLEFTIVGNLSSLIF